MVVIVPLKVTGLGPPHALKLIDALTVTFVAITARAGMTGKLFKSPDVVATLAETQQNWFGSLGS